MTEQGIEAVGAGAVACVDEVVGAPAATAALTDEGVPAAGAAGAIALAAAGGTGEKTGCCPEGGAECEFGGGLRGVAGVWVSGV